MKRHGSLKTIRDGKRTYSRLPVRLARFQTAIAMTRHAVMQTDYKVNAIYQAAFGTIPTRREVH